MKTIILSTMFIFSESTQKLFDCILTIESNKTVNVVSKTGDYGIGQINRKSWPEFDYSRMLHDAEYSINSAKQVFVYTRSRLGAEYSLGKKDSTHWVCAYNIGVSAYKLGKKKQACEAYMRKVRSCGK